MITKKDVRVKSSISCVAISVVLAALTSCGVYNYMDSAKEKSERLRADRKTNCKYIQESLYALDSFTTEESCYIVIDRDTTVMDGTVRFEAAPYDSDFSELRRVTSQVIFTQRELYYIKQRKAEVEAYKRQEQKEAQRKAR